jgi:hypothetical protein
MNGAERLSAILAGRPADGLPLMPITMMFADDQIGVPYGRYASHYETLVWPYEKKLADGLRALGTPEANMHALREYARRRAS